MWIESERRDRSNKGPSAIEFDEDDFLQVGRPISPGPGAAVSQMVDGLRRAQSSRSAEPLADLNLGDLCVLLC